MVSLSSFGSPCWRSGQRPRQRAAQERRWRARRNLGWPEGHQLLVLAEDSNFLRLAPDAVVAEIAVTVAVDEYSAAVGAAVAVSIPQEERAYGLSK